MENRHMAFAIPAVAKLVIKISRWKVRAVIEKNGSQRA
jgi:hypothetical protein